jgi:hypothetical protein
MLLQAGGVESPPDGIVPGPRYINDIPMNFSALNRPYFLATNYPPSQGLEVRSLWLA